MSTALKEDDHAGHLLFITEESPHVFGEAEAPTKPLNFYPKNFQPFPSSLKRRLQFRHRRKL